MKDPKLHWTKEEKRLEDSQCMKYPPMIGGKWRADNPWFLLN